MVLEWGFVAPSKGRPMVKQTIFSGVPRLPLDQRKIKDFIKDTPKSCKRHTRSRNSFRFGSGKSKGLLGSRSSTNAGKTVAVQGHSRLEDLEKKLEEVVRFLQFHEDAVSKDIPDYLQGTATILLENIIYLSKDLEQVFANCHSAEASRLTSRLYESVADLLKWSDHFQLRDADFDSSQSKILSQRVKEAVKELVEFAINKENQNVSGADYFHDSSKHRESNSSFGSEDSPQHDRRKLNNGRNQSLHGSLPEIPASILNGSGDQGYLSSSDQLSPNCKLIHSLSSDSIIDSKDNVVDSVNGSRSYGNNSSLTDAAPPVPPKKHRNKTPQATTSAFESRIGQISPIHPLHDCANFLRRSTGSSTCSTPHSLERSSFTTSQDSINRSLEDKLCYTSPSSNVSDISANLSLTSGGGGPSFNCSGDVALINQDLSQMYLNSSASASPCYSSQSKNFFTRSTETFCHQKRMISSSQISEISSQMSTYSSTTQHFAVQRSSRSSTCSSSTSSSRSSGVEGESNMISVPVPPPIPTKMRHQRGSCERAPSQYDNFPLTSSGLSADAPDCRHESPCRVLRTEGGSLLPPKKQAIHIIGSRSSSDSGCSTIHSSPAGSSVAIGRCEETCIREYTGDKPPLPLKKKRIMEYLELTKDYQGLPDRRSQHMVSCHQSRTFDHELCTSTRLSLPTAGISDRPALPPKRKVKNRDASPANFDVAYSDGSSLPMDACSCSCRCSNQNICIPLPQASPERVKSPIAPCHSYKEEEPPDYEIDESSYPPSVEVTPSPTPSDKEFSRKESESVIRKATAEEEEVLSALDVSDLIKLEVSAQKASGKESFQGEDVVEGTSDSLLVYATYSKNEKFLDAFLTTYRTFLTPSELITKLMRRYEIFCHNCELETEKATKSAYSLLVRVVHELNVADDKEYKLLSKLSSFEYDLLAKGELRRALLFRKELTEKVVLRKRYTESTDFLGLSLVAKTAQHYSLPDFKTHELAEQMTLIEAELFEKVGISEALQWARAQNPEKCPNLCTFTSHFNNVSYWVRTLILRSSSHDRDKYLKKFIKIMKHFRKINNFSSGLAIWAAISSMCIQRLGWQQIMTEELKEHEALFKPGFSSEYREALAEAKPPCLPCLGTIVADLTSAHNGNSDFTADGKVNFKKRWIQNKILKDFKRFNPCRYKFKKNETIIKFFNNFENCLDEEEQWKLSYKIKPNKPRND